MILFDTDTCIGLLRGYPSVLTRRKTTDEEIAVSFMTVAELYYGAEKSTEPAQNTRLVEKYLLSIKVLHTDDAILREFGKLKSSLRRQGYKLADADLLVAATCLARCDLLVTGNIRHYERISGLRLDNWLR